MPLKAGFSIPAFLPRCECDLQSRVYSLQNVWEEQPENRSTSEVEGGKRGENGKVSE